MKMEVLAKLVKEGKKPMVRLTDVLWDDSFGEKGMIARVVSVAEQPHDLTEFDFSYNEHREHNLALDKPTWFLCADERVRLGREQGTAIESNFFDNPDNIHEEVSFEENQDVPVELVETGTPLAEYMASGSKGTYVEWLEATVNSLMNLNDALQKQKEQFLREIHKT
jgi:hypothetical protein